ncbi:hypothetical protein OPV22_019070 [Ensete ventricosum]|uniref:Uncharacterized protein n=1 Tax=Ensete ventricosum TaxID=4639 RepID=A0AAV8R3D9_ENSVE|nr:hypothetical protein OPV22_019070 [Ensete ventricosum]
MHSHLSRFELRKRATLCWLCSSEITVRSPPSPIATEAWDDVISMLHLLLQDRSVSSRSDYQCCDFHGRGRGGGIATWFSFLCLMRLQGDEEKELQEREEGGGGGRSGRQGWKSPGRGFQLRRKTTMSSWSKSLPIREACNIS